MNLRAQIGDRDELLDELVSAYLQSAEEGREPDRQSWLSRYPELAAELAEFFADRDRVQGWTAPLRAAAQGMLSDTALPDAAPTVVYDSFTSLPVLSTVFEDYELLACLSRGGMGVVYKARQISLNRLVALKMIRGDDLDFGADARRFRREAELVAQLDHPHIVPVYEIGEASGRHFFSMKLIEGGNLLTQLDRFRSAPRDAAKLLMTVAQAVHHAHQRGILHRDLKPSNILLEWRAGNASAPVPHVTDFGLAKRIATDSQLTQSGFIVGSPSYMAPEQAGAHGGAVTTATDVYGLGVILYALLTGQPPFAGDTVLDTLAQVRTAEPAPPRRLKPSVPRDLETICLKCLAKEPARRYASAAHLAEDLGRFLEGKPIQARPIGPVARLTKWARRRPALAALMAVSIAAIATVAVVSMIYQSELRRALGQARAAGDEAERQKEQAVANYRQARNTVRQMLAHAADRQRADIPKLQELRRAQQEEALAFFLNVAAQQGDEPEILSDVAEARVQAGKLQMELGQPQAARENLERARDLLADLADRFPAAAAYKARLAEAWTALAGWHAMSAEGAACVRKALVLYEELCGAEPDNERYQTGRAVCHHNLGHAAWNRKDLPGAETHWRQALAIRTDPRRSYPKGREHLMAVAKTQLNLSVLYQQPPKRLAEATVFHDQAEASLEQLVREDAHDYESAASLATLRVNWAYELIAAGKSDAALPDLDKNLALLQPILKQEPNLAGIRDKLYRTYGVRGQILEDLHRIEEAVAAWEQVVALATPENQDGQRIALALLRCKAADRVRAIADADAIAARISEGTPWRKTWGLAQVYANAFPLVEKEPGLTTAQQDALRQRYVAAAIGLLDQARTAAGPEEWNKQMPEQTLTEVFKPLCDREEFRRWIKAKPAATKH